jgi:hypothetical protein
VNDYAIQSDSVATVMDRPASCLSCERAAAGIARQRDRKHTRGIQKESRI